MATLREKRPGVWEVRVFTGSDARGRPTQLSRTVHGGKRDALKLGADLEVGPGRTSPAGRNVSDVLDAWVDQNLDTWAPSRRVISRAACGAIKKGQISRVPLARLTVGDVERTPRAALVLRSAVGTTGVAPATIVNGSRGRLVCGCRGVRDRVVL